VRSGRVWEPGNLSRNGRPGTAGASSKTPYGFIADEALSRGAAIAFYTATSFAPVLLIVVAIAGLVFGQDAAQNAITGQLSELMGDQTAQLLQTAVASASKKSSGAVATLDWNSNPDPDGVRRVRRDAISIERNLEG